MSINYEALTKITVKTQVDYVTFGFSKEAVMKKLRKRYEKLKDIH